jgi:hypothetical protein
MTPRHAACHVSNASSWKRSKVAENTLQNHI